MYVLEFWYKLTSKGWYLYKRVCSIINVTYKFHKAYIFNYLKSLFFVPNMEYIEVRIPILYTTMYYRLACVWHAYGTNI